MKSVIIVAGGSGSRMGGSLPKQFVEVNGYPLLWWSMRAFHEEDPETRIILVIPEAYNSLWKDRFDALSLLDRIPHQIAFGGKTRSESVRNGLALIEEENGLTAVHDAARPVVSQELIRRGWQAAAENDCAIPVVPVTDSIRFLTEKGGSVAVDRAKYVAVQTPQVFKTSMLKQAYKENPVGNFTDDASVLEACGYTINHFPGDPLNKKVTNPGDFETAKEWLTITDE